MSLKTFIVTAEEAALAALKQAGTVLENFVITETQKLVAEVKQTDLGTTALNIISDLESKSMSGADKMAKLIADVTPALAKLKESGGLKGLEASVEDFAREMGQSVFNDFKALAGKLG